MSTPQSTEESRRMPMGSAIELVTEFLRQNGPASATDVAKATGLNPWSIRSVFARLKGEVFEFVGERQSGRRGGPEKVYALVGTLGFDREQVARDAAELRAAYLKMERLWDENEDEAFQLQMRVVALAPLVAAHLEKTLAALDRQRRQAERPHDARESADCRM